MVYLQLLYYLTSKSKQNSSRSYLDNIIVKKISLSINSNWTSKISHYPIYTRIFPNLSQKTEE